MADEGREDLVPEEEATETPDVGAPTVGAEEADAVASEVDALRQTITELEQSEDRAKRTAAFYDTRRRQAERELEETRRYGFERLAKKLVPVVDSLERALEAAEDETGSEAIRDGLTMVLKQLLDALESEGVKPVASVGQPFDPNVHEALAYQPTADVSPHHVVAEVQKGYTLHDRLLRAATVLVAAPTSAEDGPEDAPDG